MSISYNKIKPTESLIGYVFAVNRGVMDENNVHCYMVVRVTPKRVYCRRLALETISNPKGDVIFDCELGKKKLVYPPRTVSNEEIIFSLVEVCGILYINRRNMILPNIKSVDEYKNMIFTTRTVTSKPGCNTRKIIHK